MNISLSLNKLILPAGALGLGAVLLLPTQEAGAWSLVGGNLAQTERDFRVFNNFTDAAANNNTTPDDQFPGYTGAVMAIWKGSIEWGSELHGDGTGDPHQNGGLGSGDANFDPSFQGLATGVGSISANVHSELSGGSGGTLAFTEWSSGAGWRIRYYADWTWNDGPGTSIGSGNNYDLQGVACHEYGHALGLGHSAVSNQVTMWPSATGRGIVGRSIHSDDVAGLQAIYGAASANKPHISDIIISANVLTINGSNFASSGNQVWFTQAGAGGTGNPIKVTNLSSNGSVITVTVPATAGPGDILVRNNQTGHNDLSNAFPTDLAPNGGCPDPITFCATSPNSVGSGAVMGYTGTPNLGPNNFGVSAFGLPPNQFGIFFYGSNSTANLFGDGVICVAGGASGILRLPAVQSDFVGDVSQQLDFNAIPFSSGPGTWTPGSQWFMQFWYRDPAAGGTGFNLSNGLDITVCQ
jgi:Matrixin